MRKRNGPGAVAAGGANNPVSVSPLNDSGKLGDHYREPRNWYAAPGFAYAGRCRDEQRRKN